MIPPEIASFLESGVSILVGTRDARLLPESIRAIGARVEAEGAELVLFLPDAVSATTLANLRENGAGRPEGPARRRGRPRSRRRSRSASRPARAP
jgi:hypothetical protein